MAEQQTLLAGRPAVQVVKQDSSRWKVVADDGRWVGMPRLIWHPEPSIGLTPFHAKFAPRKVAQEAAEAWNLGKEPPLYWQTDDGLRLVTDEELAEITGQVSRG